MKKTILIFVLTFLSSVAMAAATFSYGGLTFETTSSGEAVYVTGVSTQGASSTTLYIPCAVYNDGTTYRVWGIQANAFKNNTTVKSIVFSWGARIIATSSFQGCTNLTEVHLSSSVARIDASAFAGCTSLQKVYYSSFDFPALGCQSSSWPSNSGMTLYISPLSEKTTSEWLAATGWNKFSSAVMSSDACDYHLGDGGQYSVGSTDDEGVSTIRNLTLIGYKKPSRVGPYDPTEDGTAYQPESNIVDAGVSFHFTRIGTGALKNQTALKKIDLTNAIFLKSISAQAFSGCSALTTLKISSSVTSIVSDSFVDRCSLLASIDVEADNQTYATYEGMLFNKSLTRLYRVPEGYPQVAPSYPPTLETVSSWSHYRCANILGSRLPYGVKTIGNYAYHSASGMTFVVIPSSVTSLGSSGVFAGATSLNNISCNMASPPTVTASTYFANPSNIDLHIPYGKQNAYTDAGWTGFASVNNQNEQAYDITTFDGYYYTVTSTANTTVNGTAYDGRVKLVSAGDPSNCYVVYYNIPSSVTYNNKTFAVTCIGEQTFNNHDINITHTSITVVGCHNIDTIGNYAFYNQPVSIYPFTKTLKSIGHYAFSGTNLRETVAIPYGVKYIGTYAFSNGKYNRIVVPQGVSSFCDMWCNTSTLTEIVYNNSYHYTYNGWNMTGVPSTCYIRVPVGVVNHYKQNSALSSRANYITAGAYDFAKNNDYTGDYFFSILNSASVTYDGTTYAGKVKYVYHPNIKSSTTGYGFSNYAVDRTATYSAPQYLITEIGDSCFAGAQFHNSYPLPAALTRIGNYAFRNAAYAMDNLVLPSGLTYIGTEAFYGTKLTGEIKIPSSVTTIRMHAFYWMLELSSLYFKGDKPTNMEDFIWTRSTNNPNLTVWLPNTYASRYVDLVNTWGDEGYSKPLGVWLKPDAESVPFSSVLPTNLSGSSINAYIASAYDKSNTTQQLTMTQVNQAAANTGMLLTGLTANQEYRIKQPTSTVSAPATNYLVGTPQYAVRIDQQNVGYYWDRSAETPHFIKPTPPSYSNAGEAYLKLSSTEGSGIDEVYTNLWPKPIVRGDINGDGSVDVSDVNIIINIMLGKISASDYPGANINGDSGVDVGDINEIINIMLGKV